jgi:hypothetical protein
MSSFFFFFCPHCFTAIQHRRNLLAHFQCNPGCPYRNPYDCLEENSIGNSSASAPLQHAPLSPADSFATNRNESEENCNYSPRFHNEEESSDDSSILILQEDLDLMDIFEDEFLDEDGNDMRVLSPTITVDLNALTLFWRPPTPNNQCPIVDRILVSPVEESLLSLLIENHLLKRMYPVILEWAHYASSQDYDFHHAPTDQTVLGCMIKKYINVSGGPPKSEVWWCSWS